MSQTDPRRSSSIDSYQPNPAEKAGLLRALYERGLLTWRLIWDNRVGLAPKLIPLLAIVYLISPVDLLPEALLGPIGLLDDPVVLLLALNFFVQLAPPDIVQEHLRELSAGRRVMGSSYVADEGDTVEGEAETLDE